VGRLEGIDGPFLNFPGRKIDRLADLLRLQLKQSRFFEVDGPYDCFRDIFPDDGGSIAAEKRPGSFSYE
jgi:hypothetical protein